MPIIIEVMYDGTKIIIEQNIFTILEDVRRIIDKNKMILVIDLDDSMIFTRRKKKSKHNNYTTINVYYCFIQLDGTIIYK